MTRDTDSLALETRQWKEKAIAQIQSEDKHKWYRQLRVRAKIDMRDQSYRLALNYRPHVLIIYSLMRVKTIQVHTNVQKVVLVYTRLQTVTLVHCSGLRVFYLHDRIYKMLACTEPSYRIAVK